MELDDRKERAEFIAQGWNPTDMNTKSPEPIQDAKAVLFFKFLAATNPFHLCPYEHFSLRSYVAILEAYAQNLVQRETNSLTYYTKFLK